MLRYETEFFHKNTSGYACYQNCKSILAHIHMVKIFYLWVLMIFQNLLGTSSKTDKLQKNSG